MKTKTIELTIEKAKEWYNGDIKALKEIALQAYTKEELTSPDFTKIKTFSQACFSIGTSPSFVGSRIKNIGLDCKITEHLVSVLKIDIIRKALNGKDWVPSLTDGKVYCPCLWFSPFGDTAKKFAETQICSIGDTFVIDGKKYSLVVGKSDVYQNGGLGGFVCNSGDVTPDPSLICCKSKEIADHMSRYFAKEIFDVCYSHILDYVWC